MKNLQDKAEESRLKLQALIRLQAQGIMMDERAIRRAKATYRIRRASADRTGVTL